jgi:hypothetical protein
MNQSRETAALTALTALTAEMDDLVLTSAQHGHLKSAFRVIDSDSSGQIDLNEVSWILCVYVSFLYAPLSHPSCPLAIYVPCSSSGLGGT